MYDRIVVPIEEGARNEALPQARTLARTLRCELTLLHVHCCTEAPAELEGLPQYRYQHVVERWDERDAELEAHEVEWLSELADAVAAEDPELKVSSRVVHAPLSRSLREGEERLLVVASAEDAKADGLGASVQEIMRAGDVPVLLVRAGAELMPVRRILVALDGSPFSEEVLAPALELARSTGARVSLLEVVTRYTGLVRLLHPGERTAETAEKFLHGVRGRIPPELGPVDVRVVEHANAAAGIATEARRNDVDLVAMATHGRGGFRRMLLGSVAESVVRSSRVPVLLFRPVEVSAPSPAPATRA
jgi:nucleotide-binding universal stress UspA family protein